MSHRNYLANRLVFYFGVTETLFSGNQLLTRIESQPYPAGIKKACSLIASLITSRTRLHQLEPTENKADQTSAQKSNYQIIFKKREWAPQIAEPTKPAQLLWAQKVRSTPPATPWAHRIDRRWAYARESGAGSNLKTAPG